jgi:hypothetical protein
VLDDFELNFWSGPHEVSANGKTYIRIPGIDGGLSILQGLDFEDISGDIRLTGSSPVILAIALNEEFQNRPLRFYWASLDANGDVSSSSLASIGQVEDIRIQEGPNSPSLEIIVRGQFSDLEPTDEVRYSAADQELVDAHDTFFDFLASARDAQPPFGQV